MIGEAVVTVPRENFFFRWETRLKLIGAMLLVFAFAAAGDIRMVPVMVACALLVFIMASLPFSFLVSRLKVPGFFLLVMALVIPFFSGTTVLLSLGPVSLKQEGCIQMLLIAAKFFCIITVLAVLFASTPISAMVAAMRSLGLPLLLADMLMFTYRYIFQLTDDFRRARTAARLRGVRVKSMSSIRSVSYIVGSLLVRSQAQAERVFRAMTLRGYGNRESYQRNRKPGAGDIMAFSLCLLLSAGIVLVQVLVL